MENKHLTDFLIVISPLETDIWKIPFLLECANRGTLKSKFQLQICIIVFYVGNDIVHTVKTLELKTQIKRENYFSPKSLSSPPKPNALPILSAEHGTIKKNFKTETRPQKLNKP